MSKACGVKTDGRICHVRIPDGQTACWGCYDALLAQLERMANEPAPTIVPRGTPRAARGSAARTASVTDAIEDDLDARWGER
jgi:hypothetical protein